MSRARDGFRDPTRVRALSPGVGHDVARVVDALPRHAGEVIALRFGLRDSEPRTHREVAAALGTSVNNVRFIEEWALTELRAPDLAHQVRDHLTDEMSAGVLQHMRELALARERPEALRECPRHGRIWRNRDQKVCPACECGVAYHGDLGRPRVYCSDECKQAAYRARRRLKS